MKEPTIEDKAIFFAQYWEQDIGVIKIDHPDSNGQAKNVKVDYLADIDYLELNSLQNITDEDAIECMRKVYPTASDELLAALSLTFIKTCKANLFESHAYSAKEVITIVDKLRSESYLIPFNGYTCEEIIKLGWAKTNKP